MAHGDGCSVARLLIVSNSDAAGMRSLRLRRRLSSKDRQIGIGGNGDARQRCAWEGAITVGRVLNAHCAPSKVGVRQKAPGRRGGRGGGCCANSDRSPRQLPAPAAAAGPKSPHIQLHALDDNYGCRLRARQRPKISEMYSARFVFVRVSTARSLRVTNGLSPRRVIFQEVFGLEWNYRTGFESQIIRRSLLADMGFDAKFEVPFINTKISRQLSVPARTARKKTKATSNTMQELPQSTDVTTRGRRRSHALVIAYSRCPPTDLIVYELGYRSSPSRTRVARMLPSRSLAGVNARDWRVYLTEVDRRPRRGFGLVIGDLLTARRSAPELSAGRHLLFRIF
ncbi:hypothetical protein EVAR_47385_1 [Eumeta japonica]|uniref:Uncharacterized protein n=1 Tax=Eumeta variegata TaxID=151549 RepID=A0A4C1WUF2_EUMVA|nr:hypothetical protein EVAR_47385_1 [Eumeta japonica]